MKLIETDNVLGVRFHRLTADEALVCVREFVQARKPRQLCLVNAYTVSLHRKDPELQSVLRKADLVLADGMSIVWGGRSIGAKLPERVAGPDLTQAICGEAERLGYRLFFLGSTPETLGKLKALLLARWPQLNLVGVYSPPMCEKLSDTDNQAIFKALHEANPDILFVGMSTPKQEKWISAQLSNLAVPVSIGIGAAFDFLSGEVPRAPLVLQRAGFEWLYRLYREPRRLWKRYLLGNAVFLGLILHSRFMYSLRHFKRKS